MWRYMLNVPPFLLEKQRAKGKARMAANLAFMTAEHRLVHHFVVRTLPGAVQPLAPSLLIWVATTVPFPGNDKPRASVRQFILLAVNIPEQDPQVGQAACSAIASSSSLTLLSAPITMASTRSSLRPPIIPASIGPPDTKMVGIFSLMAAISIPGVILSQLLIQIRASAL